MFACCERRPKGERAAASAESRMGTRRIGPTLQAKTILPASSGTTAWAQTRLARTQSQALPLVAEMIAARTPCASSHISAACNHQQRKAPRTVAQILVADHTVAAGQVMAIALAVCGAVQIVVGGPTLPEAAEQQSEVQNSEERQL